MRSQSWKIEKGELIFNENWLIESYLTVLNIHVFSLYLMSKTIVTRLMFCCKEYGDQEQLLDS